MSKAAAKSPKTGLAAWQILPLLASAVITLPAQVNAERATSPAGDGGAPAQTQRLAQAMSFEVADISAVAGQTIPMVMSIRGGTVSTTGFVMIRGVPEPIKLSSGFQTADTWMVALKDAKTLELVAPDDYRGTFKLEVTLVVRGSDQRLSHIISVDIQPKETAAREPFRDLRPTHAVADPPAAAAASPPVQRPGIESGLEQTLLQRAAQFLEKGDVASARLAYEHLALNGSALGALSLAKTHDPDVLASMGVMGMRGNPAEARRWYEKAAELGSVPASRRLQELAGR